MFTELPDFSSGVFFIWCDSLTQFIEKTNMTVYWLKTTILTCEIWADLEELF